jgi:ketosteroid isomerase-like protein
VSVSHDTASDDELSALVRRTAEAASAFIRGDMRTYLELIRHADDYTLMSPFGGEPRRGFDDSPQAIEAISQYFRNGEATLEVVETYASRELAVLVVIERQHGEVGGLPDQDLSLRVTLVFRRTSDADWELVHRHADALVHGIELDQLSTLARGR